MVNRCLLITRLCRLACPRILLISDSTPFCDFPRKHVPARLAIFVAQLGRKFRLLSLTMQRYEIFRCKTIVAGNYFRFISNVKMTNEARAEPNLFELCLARRNSTKSNDEWSKQVRMGHWDNGTKGHCVLIIHSGQILFIKIIIYI